MHLSDRRGGDRLALEVEEEPLDRVAELLHDHALGLLERERSHVVLESAQLGDDVRRHDVGPGREQLPEFHERRTELVEQLAEVLPAGGAAVRAGCGEPCPGRPAGQEIGELVRLEEVAEAVTHHHLCDLRQAAEAPRRGLLRHRLEG